MLLFHQVEVKPYVLDDQMCDECHGVRCNGKFAPFFCSNITCLQYYCEQCWAIIHARPGREFHKPLVKEGGDRPRQSSLGLRWLVFLSFLNPSYCLQLLIFFTDLFFIILFKELLFSALI